MPLHWFSPPVTVETDVAGRSYAVTNAERAADFLLAWRSLKRGPAWEAAVKACMRAIKGEIPPGEAREAFEAAAREAGRLI